MQTDLKAYITSVVTSLVIGAVELAETGAIGRSAFYGVTTYCLVLTLYAVWSLKDRVANWS